MQPFRMDFRSIDAEHLIPFWRQRLRHDVLNSGVLETDKFMVPVRLLKAFQNYLANPAAINAGAYPPVSELGIGGPAAVLILIGVFRSSVWVNELCRGIITHSPTDSKFVVVPIFVPAKLHRIHHSASVEITLENR